MFEMFSFEDVFTTFSFQGAPGITLQESGLLVGI